MPPGRRNEATLSNASHLDVMEREAGDDRVEAELVVELFEREAAEIAPSGARGSMAVTL
jgi:hypothetical protein